MTADPSQPLQQGTQKPENYRHCFLPITDSCSNQLSVPINRQNRLIRRPLTTIAETRGDASTFSIIPRSSTLETAFRTDKGKRLSFWRTGVTLSLPYAGNLLHIPVYPQTLKQKDPSQELKIELSSYTDFGRM